MHVLFGYPGSGSASWDPKSELEALTRVKPRQRVEQHPAVRPIYERHWPAEP
ncbi:hypothetical protein H5407_00500 [Mitsuaria sp. WAJ17]|uniref:hypothetical protein n=1 Tax=Mitsuaria sp. WAJ17 TaxID=2761452 RepID=UPI0015FF5DC8|nr:hypothetical protein [Mitsuaria sp. WAJ17]MBB2483698.1 hypothetical protein [Mitsuaria sp. WAJ17]